MPISYSIKSNTSLIIISLLILVTTNCSSNYKGRNDLFDDDLKGNVSKATMLFYDIVEDSGKFYRGKLEYKYIFKFNHDGNITDQTAITTTGKGSPVIDETIFNYNDKGQKTSDRHPSKSKPFSTTVFDDQGKWKEIDSFDDKKGILLSKAEFSYPDSNSSEMNEYNSKGQLLSKTTYKSHRHLVNELKKYDAKGMLVEESDFTYDSNGMLQTTKNLLGHQAHEISYKYSNKDNEGNYLISTRFYDGKPYLFGEIMLEYY